MRLFNNNKRGNITDPSVDALLVRIKVSPFRPAANVAARAALSALSWLNFMTKIQQNELATKKS